MWLSVGDIGTCNIVYDVKMNVKNRLKQSLVRRPWKWKKGLKNL